MKAMLADSVLAYVAFLWECLYESGDLCREEVGNVVADDTAELTKKNWSIFAH